MSTVAADLRRVEGRDKVTGAARYAYEHPHEAIAYVMPVASAIARGEIRTLDAGAAKALPGVLEVIWHANAPRLAEVPDHELAILQSPRVAYRGQMIAAVVAETLETAREAERLLAVEYAAEDHDVELRADHPGLYAPERVNAGLATDEGAGDLDAGLAEAAVRIDVTYTTPPEHNNPMEPHASTARWEGDLLVIHDSTQGAPTARNTVAQVFELDPEQVRVISPHVGGGFGSKGTPRPVIVLAAMASRMVGRPVKIAVTRQQMFSMVGYRTPTIQRMRLGADADGRLTAIAHDVAEQTSNVREFAEQTAAPTRVMYGTPNRRTTHRVVALDVPTPSWMRAPGECPGMYALESAMDELAYACGVDPVELRIRNEPDVEPESGLPFSSRNLVACLREGAERFGWARRDPAPGSRRDGRWLVGTGVAASTYPAYRSPAQAGVRADGDGRYTVSIGAADIGTGARTALTRIAADALGADPALVDVRIGDSTLPRAPVAGGSMGTASWGTAVVRACEALLAQGDGAPPPGATATADTTDEIKGQEAYARHAFGAQFCEVRVDVDSGEVRVSRMLGIFAAGRIVVPTLARSQLIGGMTMGIGMALMEEGIVDPAFGATLNHDLAGYHVPVCADVEEIEAGWIDEDDPHLNPMGAKGIGEIGIVGAAAAVGNAVFHATGVRVRDLPIRLDRLVGATGR